jgi:glycosyltransferase involved in cell wall biosynthesis
MSDLSGISSSGSIGQGQRAPVDVMIPTYNERMNLPHAIASVREWANNIFVLDSGSTDGTQEIARQLGAVVVEHPWEGYARQKNWGLDNLPLESPWVFILDADEAVTPELRDELTRLCGRPVASVNEAGFYINRYLMFLGKRIRHCGYFPSWNLRLFKRGQARYEDRPVHEHMKVNGPVGYLKGLMSHEDRRGLEFYITKHNWYSTLEAQTLVRGEGKDGVKPSLFGDAVQRKRFLRARILPYVPARWLARFLWMYVVKLGFLDGLTGLHFCLFISSHELFSMLKARELRRRGGPVIPPDRSTIHGSRFKV